MGHGTYADELAAAKKTAQNAVVSMQEMSDHDFVTYVREIYAMNPDWLNLMLWDEAVKRETKFRLLLKK